MSTDDPTPPALPPPPSVEDLLALRPALVRLASGWVGDAARGEELAQDALMIAIEKREAFRAESSLIGWVSQIARNLARNHNRKLHEELAADGVLEATSEEHDALRALRRAERERVFYAAIADLPQLEQDVLFLRYIEGLDRDTITARLGLEGASGARGVLQRATRHLRERVRATLISLGHGSSFFRSSG